MREEIARWLQKHTDFAENLEWDGFDEDAQEGFRCEADQILSRLKEKIEKSLLTDTERTALYAQYDGAYACQWEDTLLQAQLDKILKALEE